MRYALGLFLLIVNACASEPPATPAGDGSAPPTAGEQTAATAPAPPIADTVAPKWLILVTGITGRQGGAAANHLLERGFPVRGLTRDPQRPEAQALAARGVEIVKGDFTDLPSIERAAAGAHGMFLNSPGTVPDETMAGIAAIDAAKRAGIRHVVYTSYYHAHPEKGLPTSPKTRVEAHLRQSGVDYTILRPGTFMENILGSKEKLLTVGFREARPAHVRQQFIASTDIGFLVAEAFTQPQQWIGREVEIATDEYTPLQLAELYSQVLGQPVIYHKITWEETGIPARFLDSLRWGETEAVRADIPALRARYPQLLTYRQFLDAHWGKPPG